MSVSVLIFTLNEELHLPKCLDSLGWCDDVIVIDSFSQDHTIDIAKARGTRVFQNVFTGFGDQRNWALANAMPKYDWVLILDADECVPPSLANEIQQLVPQTSPSIGAYRVRRRFHLWGKWLRYSSLYPSWVVRLIRVNCVNYVNRGHAETQLVSGEVASLTNDLIDENLRGIDEWFERQNRYSTKDAEYELDIQREPLGLWDALRKDPLVRRAALKRLAVRLPARGLLYFLYSYVFRGGFRDGLDGLQFCRMRAIYQEMVVAKKHDLRRNRRIK